MVSGELENQGESNRIKPNIYILQVADCGEERGEISRGGAGNAENAEGEEGGSLIRYKRVQIGVPIWTVEPQTLRF